MKGQYLTNKRAFTAGRTTRREGPIIGIGGPPKYVVECFWPLKESFNDYAWYRSIMVYHQSLRDVSLDI